MKKLEHLSIDLETLGTKHDSAIISIEALLFDPYTGEQGKTFKCDIDLEDSINCRKVSGSTIKWLLKQDKKSRGNLLEDGIYTIQALRKLNKFLKSNTDLDKLKIWGNGSTFDVSILEHALSQFSLDILWKHYNIRDVRTIVALDKEVNNIHFNGINHTSLSHAKHNATIVSEAYKNVIKVYKEYKSTDI